MRARLVPAPGSGGSVPVVPPEPTAAAHAACSATASGSAWATGPARLPARTARRGYAAASPVRRVATVAAGTPPSTTRRKSSAASLIRVEVSMRSRGVGGSASTSGSSGATTGLPSTVSGVVERATVTVTGDPPSSATKPRVCSCRARNHSGSRTGAVTAASRCSSVDAVDAGRRAPVTRVTVHLRS